MQSQVSINKERPNNKFSQRFVQDIWQQVASSQIYDQIVNTPFNQGLKKGDLNPVIFAKFMVQQVVYQTQSIALWQKALIDGKNDRQFIEVCTKFKVQQLKFAQWLNKQLFLFTAKPIPSMQSYIDFKHSVYQRQTYHYIFIVNYVCYKLYVTMYEKMGRQIFKDNIYLEWINSCSSSELQTIINDIEQAINSYQHFYDREKIKADFSRIMEIQLNLWKALTDLSKEEIQK